MHIALTTCRKGVACTYCHEDITTADLMLVGKEYSISPNGNKWCTVLHWHVENKEGKCCWLEEAKIKEAEKRLSFKETRGRHYLPLDIETRKKRLYLIRKRARTIQLIKAEVENLAVSEWIDHPCIDSTKLVAYGLQLEQISAEIVNYGGVPESWTQSSLSSGSVISARSPQQEAMS